MTTCYSFYFSIIIIQIGLFPQLLGQTYGLDVDGFAIIRGDLHLFNSEDFTTVNLGLNAGVNTQHDTFRFNTMICTFAGSRSYSSEIILATQLINSDEAGSH